MADRIRVGTPMTCSFGTASAPLLLAGRGDAQEGLSGTIMDNATYDNIPPFGLCTSVANPSVSQATGLALGVLTPMPCLPEIEAPWLSGEPSMESYEATPLDRSCTCQCRWGGSIQFEG